MAIVGRYREKKCGFCCKPHRKEGPYCSKPCSNRARKHSQETKEKIAESVRKVRIEKPNEAIQYALWCNMQKQRDPNHDPEAETLLGDYSTGEETDYSSMLEGGDIWSPC